MSYLESLLAGIASTLASAALFVVTGLLDKRAGYDTASGTVSGLMFTLACLSLAYVLWLLLPYIVIVYAVLTVLGVFLLVGGIIKILLT